jgi:hypothetical protein
LKMENEKPKLWAGLGYEQVPGLANRIIARYLRGQRKNMERFFRERGLVESAERMRQIRLSRQGMMAKNRMFQEVLSTYAQQAVNVAGTDGDGTTNARATTQAVPEASDLEGARSPDVVLSAEAAVDAEPAGVGTDAGSSVPVVAVEDSGPVIEE